MGLPISVLWDCQSVDQLSPVVQRSFSTNLGLNVNSGSLWFCWKAFCWATFSILFRASNHLPWSQRFFLKFFFAKERASHEVATTCHEAVRSDLVTYRDFVTHCHHFVVRSVFHEENLLEKPLGPGYQSSNCRQKEWNWICFWSVHIWIQISHLCWVILTQLWTIRPWYKLKQTTTCGLTIMPSQPIQINTFLNVDTVLSDNNNKNLVMHLYEPCSTSLYKNFPIS